jgi:hypothetical protein
MLEITFWHWLFLKRKLDIRYAKLLFKEWLGKWGMGHRDLKITLEKVMWY